MISGGLSGGGTVEDVSIDMGNISHMLDVIGWLLVLTVTVPYLIIELVGLIPFIYASAIALLGIVAGAIIAVTITYLLYLLLTSLLASFENRRRWYVSEKELLWKT